MTNRLNAERKSHPLPIEPLTKYLFGGAKRLEIFRRAIAYLEKDNFLVEKDFSYYDLSREELRERTLAKINKIAELKQSMEDKELFDGILWVLNEVDDSFSMRLLVDLGLFLSTLEGSGTQEQINEYAPLIKSFASYGCFSMTELGTGSFLQSLETTATYNRNLDEFIIHSPTLTSLKWWIGGASQSATHTIVFAKLIIEGIDQGVHTFIVQLRDAKFNVNPGITIGDVGPKRGRNGLDNGWIRFDHVHIPRKQMLMKWSQVTDEGKYMPGEFPQLAYGVLIGGRISVTLGAIHTTKKSLTIAIRYCTIRDQHSIKGECLLDYTIQQERLIGGLCGVYAYHFALDKLSKYNQKVQKELVEKDVTNIKDLHNTAAGIKAFCLLWCCETINQAILSMGGHGYSRFAGVSDQLNDLTVLLPGEGDVIVMAQQTASYLMKTMGKIQGGDINVAESVKYLTLSIAKPSSSTLESSFLLKAAEFAAVKLVTAAYQHLQEETSKHDSARAWNNCQIELIEAAKAHVCYGVIKIFYENLENELPSALDGEGPELIPHLKNLADLFALRHMNEFIHVFYENHYFSSEFGGQIRAHIRELYGAIRPYANGLVDALGIPDIMLRSPLGRHDGEIYKHYFHAVKSTKTNIKPPYWEKYLKPLFKW